MKQIKNLTGYETEGTIGYVGDKLCIIVSCIGISFPCEKCVIHKVCSQDEYDGVSCTANDIIFAKYEPEYTDVLDNDSINTVIAIEWDKIEKVKQEIKRQEDLIQKSVNIIAKLNAKLNITKKEV